MPSKHNRTSSKIPGTPQGTPNDQQDVEHPTEPVHSPTNPTKVDWNKEGLFDAREADRNKVS